MLNPRADEQHRRAGGAENIGGDRAGEKKNHVRQRRRAAGNLIWMPPATTIQRADQRDEADVFVRRVAEAGEVAQNKKINSRRDRAETERDFGDNVAATSAARAPAPAPSRRAAARRAGSKWDAEPPSQNFRGGAQTGQLKPAN